MTAFFLRIVNISISASVFTAVILLLRPLLKKAPRWVYVLLWGLVALRLILPFSIESPVSLMPRTDWIMTEWNHVPAIEESVSNDHPTTEVPPEIPPTAETTEPALPPPVSEPPTVTTPSVTSPEESQRVNVPLILSCVWIAGICGMLSYSAISTHRLRRSLGTAIRLRDNIYESTAIDAPFVLGILKPHIYVPRGLDDGALTYVIAHEQSHIRRADHLWKPLGFLLLTVHWFNPVLWYAYVLLCGDIELACDARAVKQFGDDERADYSEVLLAYSAKHRHMISACPIAFGEADVTERVIAVLYDKKPALARVVCAMIAVTAAAVCFLTQPNDNPLISLDGLIAYFNQPKFVDPRSVPGIQIAEELTELDAVLSIEEISWNVTTHMHIYTMYYTSDGLSIRAELYLPEDYEENDYPTLLYLPANWMEGIWGFADLFFKRKINAIVVYNRGDNNSEGLERVGDYVDLEVLLDICKQSEFLSRGGIAAAGSSANAHRVMKLAEKHPDDLLGCITVNGILDLCDYYEKDAPDARSWFPVYFGATYEDHPELYREYSPIDYADRITIPTLLMGYSEHPFVSFDYSREMYDVLTANGTPCELIELPPYYREQTKDKPYRADFNMTAVAKVEEWLHALSAAAQQK